MATIQGTDGADTLIGGVRADSIGAAPGDDYARGGGGNDYIAGGAGNDTLIGDYQGDPDADYPRFHPNGADRLYGGTGDNSLWGDGGNDFLSGFAGNDYLDGGAGADRITAGGGNDYITDTEGSANASGDAGDDGLIVSAGRAAGGTGNDWFGISYVGQGDTVWTGGAGADYFNAAIYSNDGHASHITIADFKPAEGDALRMEADDAPTSWHAGSAEAAALSDTNHDGKLSALAADGSGDLYVTADPASHGLTIQFWEDRVTIAHMAEIDLSMFG